MNVATDAPIWRNGAFEPDVWVRFRAEEPAPPDTPLLVPLALFLAEPERFLSHAGPLGIELSAGEAVESLTPYLERLGLIALAFPKFSDGRNYSTARLLRERYGYQGELRAVGDVLADQIPLMRRCGILSYEVGHAPTRAALSAGRLAEVRRYYQPIPGQPEAPAGTRPWLRRPAN
jgi:phosphoadenosine phosphosulfate reductase